MSAKLSRNDVSVLITWNFTIPNEVSIVSDSIELADSISNWTLTASALKGFKSIVGLILLHARYCPYSAVDFVEAFESIITS